MAAKPLRTKPKSASAERCLRALGATRDMATPDMETSNCACEGCIVAWRFTKRQPGGRGDYWGLSLSGNCCFFPTLSERSLFVRQAANLWQFKAVLQQRLHS